MINKKTGGKAIDYKNQAAVEIDLKPQPSDIHCERRWLMGAWMNVR